MVSSVVLLFPVVGLVLSAGGCSFGQIGVAPPEDRIFLPTGIVADPDDEYIYVVNSNSDLRFNAGTIVAVDLAQAARARQLAASGQSAWPETCAKTRFSRTEPVPGDYCCRDLIDSALINCNEPQFIRSDATVQVGSFGGAAVVQRYVDDAGEVVRRLFVAVRAEPSITFADVRMNAAGTPSIRCTGPRQDGSEQPANAFCDDNWKILRPAGATAGELVLPEEPHALAINDFLGILYVGHQTTTTTNSQIAGGGVSTLDVCAPASLASPRFAGLASKVFPDMTSQAVSALASISPGDGADPATLIFATARYSAEIRGLVLRSSSQASCDPLAVNPPVRDLTMVPGEHFLSSAFLPSGGDVQGILFSADHTQAYVLHRNSAESSANPPAIVVIDRRPLAANGQPANVPIEVIDVCNGPTAMQMHDAGRGERIYVTCYDDGQIYVVDPVALAVTAVIDAGAGPTSLVFSPRNAELAFVASFANSHLSVIDLAPGSPTENRVVQRIGLPHGYGE